MVTLLKVSLLGSAAANRAKLKQALLNAVTHSQAPSAHDQSDTGLTRHLAPPFEIDDLPALMQAVEVRLRESERVHYLQALASQKACNLTLLLAHTDLQQPAAIHTDALLRQALMEGNIAFQVLYGTPEEQLTQALKTIESRLSSPSGVKPRSVATASQPTATRKPWVWACEKCSDPQCEHRLLSDLLAQRAASS